MRQRRASQVLVLNKVVLLLSLFRNAETLTFTELCEQSHMSKSTAHRLLTSLEEAGFLERAGRRGTYRLGLALFELGSQVQRRMQLRQIALHFMAELVERTGETAFLLIRDGDEALCVERIEGEHVQSLALKLGGRLPLHVGAGPRVLLAYAPSDFRKQYVSHKNLQVFTAFTIADSGKLHNDIDDVRRQGYALSVEDVTIGVAALGVPLFDFTGAAVGALSVSGITPRWTESHVADLLSQLRDSAEQISRQMGWSPESAPATGAAASNQFSKRLSEDVGG